MVPRQEKVVEQDRHIAPHRAWNSLCGKGEFSPAEHAHILHCVQCLRLFLVCLESERFGVVLKELEDPAA